MKPTGTQEECFLLRGKTNYERVSVPEEKQILRGTPRVARVLLKSVFLLVLKQILRGLWPP